MNIFKKITVCLLLILGFLTVNAEEIRYKYDSYTGRLNPVSDCDSNECQYCHGFGCDQCYNLFYTYNKYNLNGYPYYYDDYSPFILDNNW